MTPQLAGAIVALLLSISQAISWYAHDRHAQAIADLRRKAAVLDAQVNGLRASKNGTPPE